MRDASRRGARSRKRIVVLMHYLCISAARETANLRQASHLGNRLHDPGPLGPMPADQYRLRLHHPVVLPSPAARAQAARTESRNFETSSFKRLLSPDSICAANSTCAEAEPVSPAPRWTSVTLRETCWVPSDACWILREISCVAAPCCSTAAAMVEANSDSCSIVPLMSRIALTDSCVAAWMPEICWPISPVAFAVCSANAFTSDATTANPRPASPARAASMVALRASRLV